jgi:hypothetical protein
MALLAVDVAAKFGPAKDQKDDEASQEKRSLFSLTSSHGRWR